MIINVVGRIGTGKSTICRYIAEHYNFEWLQVDDIAKTIYALPEVITWVRKNIPTAIDDQNQVNFSIIRSVIFHDSALNADLLNITIPIISKKICDYVKEHNDKNYIIESFMLDTTNLLDIDEFIVLRASRDTILRRVARRDSRNQVETEMLLNFQDNYIADAFQRKKHNFSKTVFIYNDDEIDRKITFNKVDHVLFELGVEQK